MFKRSYIADRIPCNAFGECPAYPWLSEQSFKQWARELLLLIRFFMNLFMVIPRAAAFGRVLTPPIVPPHTHGRG